MFRQHTNLIYIQIQIINFRLSSCYFKTSRSHSSANPKTTRYQNDNFPFKKVFPHQVIRCRIIEISIKSQLNEWTTSIGRPWTLETGSIGQFFLKPRKKLFFENTIILTCVVCFLLFKNFFLRRIIATLFVFLKTNKKQTVFVFTF